MAIIVILVQMMLECSIPLRGRSRGRGLLIFIAGCGESVEADAVKGSISHGETLSGRSIVEGSSH